MRTRREDETMSIRRRDTRASAQAAMGGVGIHCLMIAQTVAAFYLGGVRRWAGVVPFAVPFAVVASVSLQSAATDLSKASLSDNLEQLEVVDGHARLRLLECLAKRVRRDRLLVRQLGQTSQRLVERANERIHIGVADGTR